ncbi:hypothetical protein EBB05_04940 [Methylobacterium brachiatum]|nr:hypothetical protein EBB05_04940 [Methylobacterium brachiatum]
MQELVQAATRPLSRAGEGWGEGSALSGRPWSLALSLSRTGEGTRASSRDVESARFPPTGAGA